MDSSSRHTAARDSVEDRPLNDEANGSEKWQLMTEACALAVGCFGLSVRSGSIGTIIM